MGLNKEVRDFFTGRINDVINGKIKAIKDLIDYELIKNHALDRLLAKEGVAEQYSKFFKAKKMRDEADAAMDKIRSEIRRTVCYVDYDLSQLKDKAVKEYEPIVLAELYPDAGAKIAELEKAKQDVYGAVLLATSEPKLIDALNKVLNKYGGTLQEVLDLIN